MFEKRQGLWLVCLLTACAGQTGPQGIQGEPGADGVDGRNGANGMNGTNGVDGMNGTNGANGANGVDGANGRNALVRTRSEPAGTHCAAGGFAVLTGTDTNGDGTLQDGEVTSTAYVCGSPAQVVRTDVEPRGATCAEGGVVISTGLDANGNGVLDDAEVQTRQTLCGLDASGEDVVGDVTVTNSLDYARFKNVTSISGLLTVNSSRFATTVLEFPRLRTLGAFTLSNLPSTTRISLPALTALTSTSADSTIALNPVLTTIDAPLLARTSRALTITGNTLLTAISMPALSTVGNALSFTSNGATARAQLQISVPQLTTALALAVTDNPYLVECGLRQLRPAALQRGFGLGLTTYSNNGALLGSLDAGVDAGCTYVDSCWLATRTSMHRVLSDGGTNTPDWALDGGVQGTSFLMCDARFDFETAVTECARITDGGRMVVPDAPLKNAWLQSRMAQAGGSAIWAGARDLFVDGGLPNPDGGWAWIDGSPFTSSNFAAGEPNGGNSANCLEVLQSGFWNDLVCTQTRPLVCELP